MRISGIQYGGLAYRHVSSLTLCVMEGAHISCPSSAVVLGECKHPLVVAFSCGPNLRFQKSQISQLTLSPLLYWSLPLVLSPSLLGMCHSCVMVSPLILPSSAILASFLLNEELGHIGRIGCTLCLIGSLIIVLHAPPDKEINTVDEILGYALQPGVYSSPDFTPNEPLNLDAGFLLYCFTVLVFSLVMIYAVVPRYGKKNPSVYISICSVVGSISVMAIKGFGIAVKLTFAGNNQFTHPSTYLFGTVVVGCILVQMNYFNKALDTFSTNV